VSTLSETVRTVMAAYNNGNPEPLISTFHDDVQYTIVELDRTYRGLEEVSARPARGGRDKPCFTCRKSHRTGR